MKELMLKIQPKTMCEQKDILNQTIEDWMDKEEQIDDMIGIIDEALTVVEQRIGV